MEAAGISGRTFGNGGSAHSRAAGRGIPAAVGPAALVAPGIESVALHLGWNG